MRGTGRIVAGLLLAAGWWLSLPAHAHGAQYAAPAGAAASGPLSRADSVAKSGAATGAATGAADAAGGSTGWQSWWELNKWAVLVERRHVLAASRVTPATGPLTGRGRRDAAVAAARLDPARVCEEVLPTLRALLEHERDADILDSAVLAMARSAPEDAAPAVLEAARPLLAHREEGVQASATLSLGVLRTPEALPLLQALLADASAGRILAGRRGRVPDRVRAFAALALGLANDAASVPFLIDVVERSPDKEQDLKACAIVALGLMDNAASPEAARALVPLLAERRLDDLIKAQVPTALARLATRPGHHDPSVVPALVAAFAHEAAKAPVRQSIAIALGRAADVVGATVDEDTVVALLLEAAEDDDDLAVRQFALISLARLGARDGEGDAHASVHAALRARFAEELADSGRRVMRPWAALGAALYAEGRPGERPFLLPRVRDAYDDEREPGRKSAYALALGILRDTGRAERLLEDFGRLADDEFRGCAGLALGLIGHEAAAPALLAACRQTSLSVTSRMRIAQGLGLLGDARVTGVLLDTLSGSSSLPVCAGAAGSLGLVGDASALDPLGRLAASDETVDLTRAFACVALGLLCERTEAPWHAPLTEDCNDLALVPALVEALDIL